MISEDGLLIHDMFPADADGEAVAALALALLSQAEQIGHAAGGDATGHVVVELDAGPVVVTRLDRQHSLVVLAEPGRDIGALLFDIRRHRTQLSEAV
ncbi:MAG: roadblock/LC7 domain-containing protein [Gemmatimonadales bacterium]|nr:roadblock/LC7 domain-containing protein [Gemmatimonadales bacterium]